MKRRSAGSPARDRSFLSAALAFLSLGLAGPTARVVVPGTGRMGMTDTVAGSAAKLRSSRPGGQGAS
jgi:hypothetical protein